jgi:hypothetical protein
MFTPEAVWPAALDLSQNISVPGLSPLFPHVACNDQGSICHFTTGEAEINAACTVTVRFGCRLGIQVLMLARLYSCRTSLISGRRICECATEVELMA